jgi:hypothetical protein
MTILRPSRVQIAFAALDLAAMALVVEGRQIRIGQYLAVQLLPLVKTNNRRFARM